MGMGDKHVIAIYGGPHSGKTTLAANMATILADSGYMTCLVSASDFAELQFFFKAAIPETKGLNHAVSSGRNVRESVVEVRPNLCLLEMDSDGDSYAVSIEGEDVLRIIRELRDQFTYVIIDCTSYKGDFLIGIPEADKVVVCVSHDAKMSTWHRSNLEMLTPLASRTVYVDSDISQGGTDFELITELVQVREFAAKLNYVKSANYCENNGMLIVHQMGKQERRYKDAVLKLIKVIVALEEEDTTAVKTGKAKKKKKAEAKPPKKRHDAEPEDDGEDEETDKPRKGLFHREISDRERREREMGGRKTTMTQGKRRQAENEALERALEQRRAQMRAQMAEAEADDDEDDDD